jgi:hypothetical protein
VAVKFNNAFFEDLSRSAGVVNLVTAAAEEVAATARSTAPVDSGDYRDGIKVVLKYQRRAVALVVGTDAKTMLVESKTGNLARALKARSKGRSRG